MLSLLTLIMHGVMYESQPSVHEVQPPDVYGRLGLWSAPHRATPGGSHRGDYQFKVQLDLRLPSAPGFRGIHVFLRVQVVSIDLNSFRSRCGALVPTAPGQRARRRLETSNPNHPTQAPLA